MAENVNHGSNAGNETLMASLKGNVNDVLNFGPVKFVLGELREMGDMDRGGFNQIHVKRGAGTIVTWLRERDRLLKEAAKAERNKPVLENPAEPQTQLHDATADKPTGEAVADPARQTPPEVKAEVKPEFRPEVKVEPTTSTAPEVKAPETSGASSRFGRTKAVARYGTAGLSAFGVVAGYQGFQKARKEGDGVGMTLNGANVAVCTTDLTLNVMKAAGKADKMLGAVKFVNKANVVLCVADIGWETYKEPGSFVDRDADGDLKLGHKSERLIASTASAGAGMAGFAAGASLAGAIGGAVIFPATVALLDAYLVNKAANIIIDTRRTYEEVDKTFRPDNNRHANFVGGMARGLGNDAMNKSLQEAGVKVDPETGRVSMKTLNAALADPEEGKYAMGRLKGLIMNIRDEDQKVKEPHMPRWIQFTDAQADARQKYEYAKMDARSMNSALTEADGYVADLKKKRADAAAAAQAELDGKMKAFNALPPEVQEDIVIKLRRDYGAYKTQAGGQAMDLDSYVAFGKITAANDAQLVASLTKAEAEMKPWVDYVAGKQLDDWKKQNPNASAADAEAERKTLSADIRRDAIADPKAFQQKIEKYQAEEPAEPAQPAASGTLNAQNAAPGERTRPVQAPAPA